MKSKTKNEELKPTPGPYEYNRSDGIMVGIFKRVAPGIIIKIAEVLPDASKVDADSPNAGSHFANAALLTAAPELLAACYEAERALSKFEDVCLEIEKNEKRTPSRLKSLRCIRAAITKTKYHNWNDEKVGDPICQH